MGDPGNYQNNFLFAFQFVCMGGTPKRVEQFAFYIMEEIGHKLPSGTTLQDISHFSYRYSMYKVGPILSISVSIAAIEENETPIVWNEQKHLILFKARNGYTVGRHTSP